MSDDPILGLMTAADLARMGLSRADVGAGLDVLARYRLRGLPAGSVAGDAVRALSGEEFTGWAKAGPEQLQLVEAQGSSRQLRDARIVELRRRGYTLEQIAAELGMSKAGVYHALKRLTGEDEHSREW